MDEKNKILACIIMHPALIYILHTKTQKHIDEHVFHPTFETFGEDTILLKILHVWQMLWNGR